MEDRDDEDDLEDRDDEEDEAVLEASAFCTLRAYCFSQFAWLWASCSF